MWSQHDQPREGDLYKRVTVAGHQFELRYGYYEEQERLSYPPVVLFPDLSEGLLHCEKGYPLVTQVQDPCEFYCPKKGAPDNWCGDCSHYEAEHREIGICRCEHRRKLSEEGGI